MSRQQRHRNARAAAPVSVVSEVSDFLLSIISATSITTNIKTNKVRVENKGKII
jgi:hypothetical protein